VILDLDLVPSLRELVQAVDLAPERLVVAFERDTQKHIRLVDKNRISVSDGQKITSWPIPSLRELFRGERLPPTDMDHYPPQYTPHFFFIETQVLALCDAMGDRTDQELEEIYSALKRRPDGRSLGIAHDFLWQVMAVLLGRYALSEAEYEALVGALVRSTRKWGLRPVSRNYAAFLRQNLRGEHATFLLPR
jgi:hypothetical protein